MSNKDESLKETGRCAAASIVEMVEALECDYDRLEELRPNKSTCSCGVAPDHIVPPGDHHDSESCALFLSADDADELKELESAAGECTSREEAETRIQEDALSVEVRSDWHTPGAIDSSGPTEFMILLSTGGPATRIMGEPNEDAEPVRAWLEVQDWGTPWTRYFDISQDTLLTYARCFYFGEG